MTTELHPLANDINVCRIAFSPVNKNMTITYVPHCSKGGFKYYIFKVLNYSVDVEKQSVHVEFPKEIPDAVTKYFPIDNRYGWVLNENTVLLNIDYTPLKNIIKNTAWANRHYWYKHTSNP